MHDELQQLAVRIQDTAQQLDFAQAGGNEVRIAKLTRELNAMMRDWQDATGQVTTPSRPTFNEAIQRALQAELSGDGREISAAWGQVRESEGPVL